MEYAEGTGESLDSPRVLRTDGGAVGETVGETVCQPCEHPANASTNRSGRMMEIASAVPKKI
jgi:hypothetical protein